MDASLGDRICAKYVSRFQTHTSNQPSLSSTPSNNPNNHSLPGAVSSCSSNPSNPCNPDNPDNPDIPKEREQSEMKEKDSGAILNNQGQPVDGRGNPNSPNNPNNTNNTNKPDTIYIIIQSIFLTLITL